MKKIIKAGVSLAAIPYVLLTGCSETATSQKEVPELRERPVISSQNLTKELIESPRFPHMASYQAIKPSQKAQPLEKKYTKEQLANMPKSEAHGDKTDRSVPLGQVLQKGASDQTDGPLQKYRIVSYYGSPHSKQMGILGEYSPQALMEKLKKQTRAYSELDPKRPAIPAIELITTIAQRNPGPKGLYVHPTPTADIEKYAKLATENNAVLILDVQLGRDTVMNEVKSIEKYLKLPNVYLAIDTEFHVGKGQVPGENLGHVDGNEIQEAIEYVSKLTKENRLPHKVVVVHQFAGKIISNKSAIHPTKNVEVVLNNDGFGIPALKRSGYHQLVRNQPIQYGGFKLFYKNDQPLMTPKEVLEMDPAPAFINYQ
ncbi:hypothetical protein SAMN05443252_101331 [Bacillus sp. OV322]|uniref:hypothetical protein n=1 Tax=Bacillus sp. OV322 TaxID=1882764 RepID=UPI0008F1B852|nr:hypothetical protein [Bacillus sp. OV322]SFB98848.1 hypothetical protein SAMN05443252_101331 [Bacillus sp. OV322]